MTSLRECAAEGVDHTRYLLRLAELELIERERRMVERRIKDAKFPAVKSLDFLALPSLNKTLVLELALTPQWSWLHGAGLMPNDCDAQIFDAAFDLIIPCGRAENDDRARFDLIRADDAIVEFGPRRSAFIGRGIDRDRVR